MAVTYQLHSYILVAWRQHLERFLVVALLDHDVRERGAAVWQHQDLKDKREVLQRRLRLNGNVADTGYG